MIIEDINLVPFYIEKQHILMIELAGMQSPDGPEEPTLKERATKTVFCMNFHIMMAGIKQIYLNKQQYDKLWEDLKNDDR